MTESSTPDTRFRRPGPPWRPGPGRSGAPGPPFGVPGRGGPRLWALPLAVAAVQLVGSGFAAGNQPDRAPLDAFARVLLLAGPALLLLRRRYPRITVYGTCAAAMLYFGVGHPYGPIVISVAIAFLAAVVAGHRRAAWAAAGLLWAGHLLIGHWLYRWLPPAGDTAMSWGPEWGVAAWVAAVAAAAELVRVRREAVAREWAARRQAERRRADEERLRIARELHDVLAHSISVINVQAGVGLALLDQDPEQARTALTTIKAASKEVLGEVRQVLDTLRAPGDATRSPAPGLDRLPELAEHARRTGLSVDVTVTGEPAALPLGADLAAFRIVQEALTNIVKHSGARTARVELRHAPRLLEIRVEDDGPATGDGTEGTGKGLIGMRERAAALGGTVEAGPGPDGGFRVAARLPLRATDPAPAPPAAGRPEQSGQSEQSGKPGHPGRPGHPDSPARACRPEPPEEKP
ncbi:sensor histidine kinase [Streptomyces sp. Ru87]|uniref:sensor histidine kinase n=1 Tax=Streptomyces sp. Ru87 TaxID=2044307 RepID=UPI000BF5900C|nr:sensor histidine kinase [Streptomyces sp. Ru87]PGH51451.1 two-component sensor histidine kinase [Streptomyces sp. Ru87]